MTTAARLLLAALLVVWCALIVLILAACGGGTAPQSALAPPVATPAPPVAQTPPSAPPAASAAHPSQAASAPVEARSWVEIWREPWDEPLRLGGWVRHRGLVCDETRADADLQPESAMHFGYPWSQFASLGTGRIDAGGGRLLIDAVYPAGAILGATTFDHRQPLRLSATVDLQPDAGAWLGLPLISDENDYRQLVLTPTGDRSALDVWLYAPCYAERIGIAPLGPRQLALEYTPPPADICWRYFVDGQLWRDERCDHRGAPLASPPRAALYIINLEHGDRTGGGSLVRAVVGPITVETR